LPSNPNNQPSLKKANRPGLSHMDIDFQFYPVEAVLTRY
jgi:hypothetical protein